MLEFDSNSHSVKPSVIWCRFTTWRSCFVSVDLDAKQIGFRNCHVPRRFLARAQGSFVCSLSEIRGVHFTPRTHRHPGGLTVVTTTGKAFISANGSSFAKLRDWFSEAVPDNDPDFATGNPAIFFVYLVGALLGIFLGVFLARDAGNTGLMIGMVLGAIVGTLCGHAFARFGALVLQADFSQPIMCAVYGLLIGILLAAVLRPFLGGNLQVTVAIIIGGVIIGGMAAAKRHSLRKRKIEQNDQPDY